jgi:multicomponent Na+:H+ antiporter subunit C
MSIATVIAIAALIGGGVWLLLDRDGIRAVLGAGLLGHGVVLLLVLSGRAGTAPLTTATEAISDPIPQALALTAIVIGFGATVLLLAIASGEPDDTNQTHNSLTDGELATSAQGQP